MAPVSGSLVLLILFCAGALADGHGKPRPPPPRPPPPPPRAPSDKPGKCPPGPLAKCSVPLPPGDCKVDKDCTGNYKCCMEMCTPKCKKPVPDVKPGTCPPQHIRCPGPPKPRDCRVDSDCLGVNKCCEKDCELQCWNPNDKKPIEKSGRCPPFYTFAPCDPHPKYCFGDYECPGNYKCCDYECKWQCKQPQ